MVSDDSTRHNELMWALAEIRAMGAETTAKQSDLFQSMQHIKTNQQELANTVCDIATRLAPVEAKADTIGSLEQIQVNSEYVNVISQQYNRLSTRMELEDRARRNNLIFYVLSDGNKTWKQTEDKIIEQLQPVGCSALSPADIEQAHRIGSHFEESKCRHVIVRFQSFKTKETILSGRANLRGTNISVSEYYCKATRVTWKKLTNFPQTLPGSPVYRLSEDKF